jgi:hypothetical protein
MKWWHQNVVPNKRTAVWRAAAGGNTNRRADSSASLKCDKNAVTEAVHVPRPFLTSTLDGSESHLHAPAILPSRRMPSVSYSLDKGLGVSHLTALPTADHDARRNYS